MVIGGNLVLAADRGPVSHKRPCALEASGMSMSDLLSENDRFTTAIARRWRLEGAFPSRKRLLSDAYNTHPDEGSKQAISDPLIEPLTRAWRGVKVRVVM